jgi:hypothetical protein
MMLIVTGSIDSCISARTRIPEMINARMHIIAMYPEMLDNVLGFSIVVDFMISL